MSKAGPSASKAKADKHARAPGQLSVAHMFQKAAANNKPATATATTAAAAADTTEHAAPAATAAAGGGRTTRAHPPSAGAPAASSAASASAAADPWDHGSLRAKLVHRTDKQHFELFLPNAGEHGGSKDRAVLQYQYASLDSGSVVLDLTHTAVPSSAQGRGVAGLLVQHAFEFAQKEGIQVRPSCSYIATFLDKNPKWRDRVERKATGGGAGAGAAAAGKTFQKQHLNPAAAAAAASAASHHAHARQNGVAPAAHTTTAARRPVDGDHSPRSGDKRRSPSFESDDEESHEQEAEWKAKRGKLDEAALRADHLAPPVEPTRRPHTAAAASSSAAAASSSAAAAASSSAAVAAKPAIHIPPGFVPLPHNPQFAKKWSTTLMVLEEALSVSEADCAKAADDCNSTAYAWGNCVAASSVMRRLSLSKKDLDTRCLGFQFLIQTYIEDDAERARLVIKTLPFMMRLIQRLPTIFDNTRKENENLAPLPPACVPTLRANTEGTLNLTKLQLAALLACSFFGLQVEHIPRRNAYGQEVKQFKSANFDGLWLSIGLAVRRALGTGDTPEEIRSDPNTSVEKIKCILAFFERTRMRVEAADDSANPHSAACKQILNGVVTFHRKVLKIKRHEIETRITGGVAMPPNGAAAAPRGPSPAAPGGASANLAICPTELRLGGTIEDDGYGTVQIDFANKFLGGGVLTRGCVQEEIRLTINPESLVGLLFVECMEEHESVTILGAERFANYSGYSDSFKYAGPHFDPTPIDPLTNRLRTVLVAIDAVLFRNKALQYKRDMILREILKAYAGFSLEDSIIGVRTTEAALRKEAELKKHGRLASYLIPELDAASSFPAADAAAAAAASSSAAASAAAAPAVAPDVPYSFHQISTGNWGCGAFGAEVPLKLFIQLIAATLSHRSLRYFTFGSDTCDGLPELLEMLAARKVTVRDLYTRVCLHYHPMRQRARSTMEYVRDLLDGTEDKLAAQFAEEERIKRAQAAEQRANQQKAAAAAGAGAAGAARPFFARAPGAAPAATAAAAAAGAPSDETDDPIQNDFSDEDPSGYDSEAAREAAEREMEDGFEDE